MFWRGGIGNRSGGVADRAGGRARIENLYGISAGQWAAGDARRDHGRSPTVACNALLPVPEVMFWREVCRLLKRPPSVLSSLVLPLMVV